MVDIGPALSVGAIEDLVGIQTAVDSVRGMTVCQAGPRGPVLACLGSYPAASAVVGGVGPALAWHRAGQVLQVFDGSAYPGEQVIGEIHRYPVANDDAFARWCY